MSSPKKKPAPPPYTGSAATVDALIKRLEHVEDERFAIIEELRRQRDRAKEAIERWGR